MRKIISFVLCLVLLTALAVPAMASHKRGFDRIFSIGDSNGMAFGMRGYKGGEIGEDGMVIKDSIYTNDLYLNGVPGSYTDAVRIGLGLNRKNCNAMTYPAFRIKDALYYLDAGEMDAYHTALYSDRYIYCDRDAYRNFDEEDPLGVIYDTADSMFIKKAKQGKHPLFLCQSCSSDLFFSLIEQALRGLLETNPLELPAYIESSVESFWTARSEFRQDYPALIERLQELNGHATIALIGMFNPLKDLYITDINYLPLFNAFDLVIEQINRDIAGFAEEYGCIYVDIPNVETYTLGENVSLLDVLIGKADIQMIYHATPAGQQYIARQILDRLSSVSLPETHSVSVDLCGTNRVDRVLLDGEPVSDYTLEKTILTVPCADNTAKSLTVMAKNEKGGLDMKTYQLSWQDDEGYTAYRRYGKNGLLPITTKLADTVRSAVSSTVSTTVKVLKNVLHGGILRLTK